MKKRQQGEMCCVNDALLMDEYMTILQNWYPDDGLPQGNDGYYVINFISYNSADPVNQFGITINGIGYSIFFNSGSTLQQNIDAIVTVINNGGIFTAERDGDNLWIYAPAGYNGIVPVLVYGTAIVLDVYTTLGFQGGVFATAANGCLSENAIGNIITNLKQLCGSGCNPVVNDTL